MSRRITPPAGLTECDQCDGTGYDGIEPDTGCYYACYRCGTTGWVPRGLLEQEQREREAREMEREQERSRRGPPCPVALYFDDEIAF